ncbi:MAG TPA: nucleoside triphosphate pyrophosphohydrolase family protein [Burkholderiaceae bacterium]|nr:nucleoside triphosphate pyrophosphohydrolase family protein [Burkholderiaceae bacterium]
MRADHIDDGHRLTLASYQAEAGRSNKFDGIGDAAKQLCFGLFGEVGGLLSAVKKEHRDLTPADHFTVTEELGDALWYLTMLGKALGHDLQQVGLQALAELQRRFALQRDSSHTELSFKEIDGLLAFCSAAVDKLERSNELSKLGANAGRLLRVTGDTDLADSPVDKLLADVLADMTVIAAKCGQTLGAIAEANLEKISSRWPAPDTLHIPLFDEQMSALEQLPRMLEIHFIERSSPSGGSYVIQQLNGVNIGDRLTDNRHEEDGYRFHDVFHLAYLVHLGWSPVLRGLLKLKRKSDAKIDENEDGARAMIIEEGIATWIFNHALGHDLFANVEQGRLEYGILKQVKEMVRGYEVAACPLWQWERAILEGFAVFRDLYSHRGGVVTANLKDRTLTFRPAATPPPQVAKGQAEKRPLLVTAVPPPEFADI